ncbi:MAG TPA: PhoX family phosphatase [Afifellaceae bacterium]|nr:PhoX family phosphatase [Afifellaceae bacterium]
MNEHVRAFATSSLAFEASEDAGSNGSENPTMGDLVAGRYSRRDILKGSLAVAAISATVCPAALMIATAEAADSPFGFPEIEAGVDETHHVAEGHDAEILIRWGDPIFPDAPDFDPRNQSAEAQARQFGYNNDFVGLIPVPGTDDTTDRALLVVNHEYTNEELMFPGLGIQDGSARFAGMTPQLVEIEMMAHGGSVLELRREAGKWSVVKDSPFNRRVTAETEMLISGPAAGAPRMRTTEDPTGTRVRGMLNNCAGGVTPWGTWLSAEENFNGYFSLEVTEEGLPPLPVAAGEAARRARQELIDARRKALLDQHPEARTFRRYGVPAAAYAWGRYHNRFDVMKEPNEANRFGWIVEIDPTDPNSVPKKRTALGRFKHEGAAGVLNKDGRYVVYSGDDERFDYVYRFVTARTYAPDDRAANMDLLDEGTLSVARFEEDGTVIWLPLVHGEGPLTAKNGFRSQADVLIGTRLAADLLGATKMDRPEDVEANAETGKIYVLLTNNTRRKPEDVNAANPRAANAFGHIIELTAPEGDHAADKMNWEILVKCGDPSVAEVGATFSTSTTEDGWFGMPDNCAIDSEGRLWIATDGNSGKATGRSDGLWQLGTEGAARGTSRHFFRCPAGGELCGPVFTPDMTALFVAVQHPGDDGEDWPAFGRVSTFDDPSTRWPDFEDGVPPRPSVMVITKQGGGQIAG